MVFSLSFSLKNMISIVNQLVDLINTTSVYIEISDSVSLGELRY